MNDEKNRSQMPEWEREWDVEQILRESRETPAEDPQPPQREMPRKSQPVRPAQNRKKKKKGGAGRYLPFAATLVMLVVCVAGLAVLAIHAFSPGTPATTRPTGGDEPVPTPPPTEDVNLKAQELIAEADLLAVGYDYDAAVAKLAEYGSDWQTNDLLAAARERLEKERNKLVRWADTTQITHIFFHSLIVDTDRSFDGDYSSTGYNQYMATVSEFEKILQSLYDRGFVLVRIHDIAKLTTNADGEEVYAQGDIYLPPGKTPIIISQDDVNYYEYMIDGDGDGQADARGDGFANKIVIGQDGKLTCEYVTAGGQTVYGDYDLVPILERFIQQHPDFSYRGARAIIAVTGYEGVFGYRTHPKYKETLGQERYEQEVEQARRVAQQLRDEGWEIASHSFGHPAYGNLSEGAVKTDIQKWEDQVQPIVGDSDIFIYPYGSDIAGVGRYRGEKFDALYAAGYRFFCNVDSTKYWVQIRDKYVRQGRRNIDGYRMWWDPDMLDDLFIVEEIFDKARPTPVPSVV